MSTTTIGAPARAPETTRSWLGPPLRTLRQPAFDAACAALMRQVEADYEPDMIIGIRTGGLVVAEAMSGSRPRPLPVLPMTCRRASTGTKTRSRLIRATLARSPRPVADVLRRLEHRWITSRRVRQAFPQSVDHSETGVIAARLQDLARPPRVLVADDAVDSGVTLETVVQHLRKIGPAGMELRSAAITQTLPEPKIVPDYVLYRGILCRFPWSLDAAR